MSKPWNPRPGEWRLALLGGVFLGLAYTVVPTGGIDTPETKARCAHEARLAGRATRRMAQLLGEGPFALSPIAGRDEDRYGRKLRIVTRDGVSLGDRMVAEGLARTWSGRREPWC